MPEREAYADYVRLRRRKSRIASKVWSALYHACLGVAGVISIAVRFIAQSDSSIAFQGFSKDATIALLSSSAAVLSFLAGFGGFERKWRANRLTRCEMEKIDLLLQSDDASLQEVRSRIFATVDAHEGLIVPATQASIRTT